MNGNDLDYGRFVPLLQLLAQLFQFQISTRERGIGRVRKIVDWSTRRCVSSAEFKRLDLRPS